MRWVLVGGALLLSACLQSNLLPCGDALCPRGSTCVSNVCATPDQLAACSSATDGDACTLKSGSVGRCSGGVCSPTGCGNHRIDPGEVCDDGNVSSGDGCGGTCDSDESCGNGVLDVVTGESCDCGSDPGHMPASCTMPNSDDVRSECTSACKLRRCGDGEVAGAEVCDGAVADTVSCTNFGYYTGEVACSALCQFDVSGCTERCGDGVVQSHFETCDGAEPANQTCLDFGYDLGWLGCTSVCTAGVANCDRFGWSRAHPRIAVAADVVARDPRVLIRFSDGKVSLLVNDTADDPTGTFRVIATTATTSYAIDYARVAEYTTSGWTDLPVAPPWTGIPTSAWASPSIGLLVAVMNDPNVYQWTGATWTTLPLPGGAMAEPRFGGSLTKPAVFDWHGTQLAWWNGGGFNARAYTIAGASSLEDVAETSTTLFIASNAGLYSQTSQGSSLDNSLLATRVVANTLGGVDVLAASKILRIGAGALVFDAPAGTAAIAEDLGRIYVVGPPGGVFALRKGAWQENSPSATAAIAHTYLHEAVAVKGNTDIVITGPDTEQYRPGRGWNPVPVPPGALDEIKSSAASYAITNKSLTIVPTTGSATSLDFQSVQAKRMYFSRGSLFVAGAQGLATYIGGVLNETPIANSTFNSLDGASDSDVTAVGVDDVTGLGLVYRILAGGTWLPVDPGIPLKGLRDVFTTPSGRVYAITKQQVAFGSAGGGDWKILDVPGADLVAISGTSENDYFVAGGASFGFPFTGLAHWDGTHFYSVRLPAAGTPRDIFVTQGAVYLLLADDTGGDSVWVLVRSTVW